MLRNQYWRSCDSTLGDAVPPWVGYHEESSMKRQILALSSVSCSYVYIR